ncbi:MAG: excinuclease ABC subunit B, partial [Candidatus Micrarchaeota archaeon]|nr:excinuclease ABC subunit B [Candidatus Micrarchaeota archaeon]
KISRQGLLHSLIEIQYERNSQALESGRFRVRGDSVDVIPAYESNIIRVEIEEDRIKSIKEIDHLSGELISKIDSVTIYPARQYVVPPEKQHAALEKIREELIQQLPKLPMLEAQRLEKKVKYDLEMIKEMGYCSGIENYSRHFDGRREGEPPYVLLDYFPKDFLLIIDES